MSIKTSCLYTCTNNDRYLSYIPYVIENCQTMKIHPYILLINFDTRNNVENLIDKFNSVATFEFINIPNVNDVFVSQIIRLYYPALLSNFDVVMINDIDLIMIKHPYFDECINIANNKDVFVAGRLKHNQYFIAFNFAKPKIWSQIFKIHCKSDVINKLDELWINNNKNGTYPWGLDQMILYNIVSRIPNKVVINKKLYNIKSSENKDMIRIQGMFQCNSQSHFDILYDQIEINKYNNVIMYTEAHGNCINTRLLKLINETFH